MDNPFLEILNEVQKVNRRLEQLERHIKKSEEKNNEEEENLLNVDQVCKLLHIKKSTLYGYCSRKEIGYYKRGRYLYFCKQTVLDFIKKHKKAVGSTTVQDDFIVSRRKKC